MEVGGVGIFVCVYVSVVDSNVRQPMGRLDRDHLSKDQEIKKKLKKDKKTKTVNNYQRHPEKCHSCNLRLVDAAVVEDKVDAGKFLACLLGFQIELHHPLITCNRQTHENKF